MVSKASPPAAVIGAHLYGVSIPEAIQWVTLLYVFLMCVHKGMHIWKELTTGRVTPESEGEMP